MITIGHRSSSVSQIQKYLSLLGYDLIIDGHFGNRTLRSLKAFQKKYGLIVDGIPSSNTISALKAAQKRTSKEEKGHEITSKYNHLDVDINYNQPFEQYLKQSTKKNKIFIKNTESGPDAKNVIKYWNENYDRASTAFVISGRGDDDGKIYEAFNSDYWSFHLGVKGTSGKLDKSSVGISICSWGVITKKGENFYNIHKEEVPSSEVYALKDEWRGSLYYHKYSDNQIESLEKLILWITNKYKIPVQNIFFDENWLEYNQDLVSKGTFGIWSHTNVRKDKKDLYPDERIFSMLNRIKEKN